jgi:hypothetical protein
MNIKKVEQEKQIFFAEVYIPDFPDAHGDYMTPDDIEKMAHEFLRKNRTSMVDLEHDNDTSYGCYVVESFIARENDPLFIEKSWVVAVKVDNAEIWEKVKSGEINGLSMEVWGTHEKDTLELTVPEKVQGETDLVFGHSHIFYV